MLTHLLKFITFRFGRFKGLYLRICRPSGVEYGNFLRKFGGFYSIGSGVSINYGTSVTDPAYVRLGNNVTLSDCTLIGHDGVVQMLHQAYGARVDSVGKIDIRDNVFVGHGAIVMPGVRIGPNAVVAAGAVVTKDVEEGVIVGGIPARPIGRVDDLVRKLEDETALLPWRELILSRKGGFDAAMEPELVAARVRPFFGSEQQD